MGVYLRDWSLLQSAWKIYRDNPGSSDAEVNQRRLAINKYQQAYEPIEELAEAWGLEFTLLCEFITESPDGHVLWDGPFCGAFHTTEAQKEPFIGITFKGTNPFRASEVLVDYNYQLQAASAAYLGQNSVSLGVYTGLFGEFKDKNDNTVVPYLMMKDNLEVLAASLPNRSGPVVIHVTGHSLGGSYSQLCYAQLCIDGPPARAGGPNFSVGDEYTFGAPRVGTEAWSKANGNWVGAQQGSSWRIVNDKDLVPQVPATSLKPDQLDFYHLDQGWRIFKENVPELISTEVGGPPPPPYEITSFADFVNTIVNGTDHLPNGYHNAMLKAISSQKPLNKAEKQMVDTATSCEG